MQELGSTREEGAASDPPGLPPFLASRISFQTGGFKQPNQEEETLILWNTFKQCYATEADAEAAVNKNSMTVNPSMNSPSKISGRLRCSRSVSALMRREGLSWRIRAS